MKIFLAQSDRQLTQHTDVHEKNCAKSGIGRARGFRAQAPAASRWSHPDWGAKVPLQTPATQNPRQRGALVSDSFDSVKQAHIVFCASASRSLCRLRKTPPIRRRERLGFPRDRRKDRPTKTHLLDTPNGRIAAHESAGRGPAAVLLHGNSASSRAFAKQLGRVSAPARPVKRIGAAFSRFAFRFPRRARGDDTGRRLDFR